MPTFGSSKSHMNLSTELRRRGLKFVDEFRVPIPDWERDWHIDIAFPELLLAVEVLGDGLGGPHDQPGSARRDRMKRQFLQESGWTLVEVGADDCWDWKLTKQADRVQRAYDKLVGQIREQQSQRAVPPPAAEETSRGSFTSSTADPNYVYPGEELKLRKVKRRERFLKRMAKKRKKPKPTPPPARPPAQTEHKQPPAQSIQKPKTIVRHTPPPIRDERRPHPAPVVHLELPRTRPAQGPPKDLDADIEQHSRNFRGAAIAFWVIVLCVIWLTNNSPENRQAIVDFQGERNQSALSHAYQQIEVGMTVAQVRPIIGKPDQILCVNDQYYSFRYGWTGLSAKYSDQCLSNPQLNLYDCPELNVGFHCSNGDRSLFNKCDSNIANPTQLEIFADCKVQQVHLQLSHDERLTKK